MKQSKYDEINTLIRLNEKMFSTASVNEKVYNEIDLIEYQVRLRKYYIQKNMLLLKSKFNWEYILKESKLVPIPNPNISILKKDIILNMLKENNGLSIKDLKRMSDVFSPEKIIYKSIKDGINIKFRIEKNMYTGRVIKLYYI